MDELHMRLRDLGEAIEWPATPELSVPVAAPARRPRLLPRARLAAAAAGLALLMLAGGAIAFPGARESVLDWIGIGGVEVRRVPAEPRTVPADLGPRVSLSQARSRAGHRLVAARGLGRPDAVHLRAGALGTEVTLVYGALLLTQVEGRGATDVVAKQVGPGTRVEPVSVNGRRGVWIAGEPHGASVAGSPLRLAADTLVWERAGLVLRLGGASGKADALRVARSVR